LIPEILHAIGVVLFALFWVAVIVLLARSVRPIAIGSSAAACQPADVLGILASGFSGTIRGAVSPHLTGAVFAGTLAGRALTIRPLATCYEVTLDTGLGGFTLTGEEAIAHLARAAGTEEAKGIPALIAGDADWRAMHRIFSAHDVSFERGLVRARIDFGGGVLGASEEAERLERFLERLVHASAALGSLAVLKPRETGDARCPYCHDELGTAGTTSCSRCGTLHHTDCFAELGRCATFACGPVKRSVSA
jgi:hypothetical protein